MKLFNAFQMIVILIAIPLVLPLIQSAEFSGHIALFWVAIISELILACIVIGMVYDSMDS
jgi:hypothetical protein